jgi:hypothetical protein
MPLTVTENALVGAVVEFSVSLYDSVRTVPVESTDALLNAGAVKSTVELLVVIARDVREIESFPTAS